MCYHITCSRKLIPGRNLILGCSHLKTEMQGPVLLNHYDGLPLLLIPGYVNLSFLNLTSAFISCMNWFRCTLSRAQ